MSGPVFRESNRIKHRAHMAVSMAVAKGTLRAAECCGDCGEAKKLSAHHDDYTRPLEVRWLCHGCHAAWHRSNQAVVGITEEPVMLPLTSLLLEKRITQEAFADAVLASKYAVRRWLDGSSKPSRAYQRLIAERLRLPESLVNSWWAA